MKSFNKVFFGVIDDTDKSVRPPLGKLGRKDNVGEGRGVTRTLSDSNESEPSYYESRRRITFRFEGGNAYILTYEDYH